MNKTEQILENNRDSDFSGGPVVKKPPANAGHTGSLPGPGRSHMSWAKEVHAPQLLNLCPRAWKLQLLSSHALEPVLCAREATTMRSPGTSSRESPRAAQP